MSDQPTKCQHGWVYCAECMLAWIAAQSPPPRAADPERDYTTDGEWVPQPSAPRVPPTMRALLTGIRQIADELSTLTIDTITLIGDEPGSSPGDDRDYMVTALRSLVTTALGLLPSEDTAPALPCAHEWSNPAVHCWKCEQWAETVPSAPDPARAAFVEQVRTWHRVNPNVLTLLRGHILLSPVMDVYRENHGWPATLEAIAEAIRGEQA